MALGATRPRLVRQLVTEQFGPVVVGLVGGGLLAAWAVRFLRSYLYELTIYDVRIWTGRSLSRRPARRHAPPLAAREPH
jgi:hypothetical protein